MAVSTYQSSLIKLLRLIEWKTAELYLLCTEWLTVQPFIALAIPRCVSGPGSHSNEFPAHVEAPYPESLRPQRHRGFEISNRDRHPRRKSSRLQGPKAPNQVPDRRMRRWSGFWRGRPARVHRIVLERNSLKPGCLHHEPESTRPPTLKRSEAPKARQADCHPGADSQSFQPRCALLFLPFAKTSRHVLKDRGPILVGASGPVC